MITDPLKPITGKPQMKHPTDFAALADHPHFMRYLSIEPHLPAEGPQAVRSWFGGMPEIPESQTWPKAEDQRSLGASDCFSGFTLHPRLGSPSSNATALLKVPAGTPLY